MGGLPEGEYAAKAKSYGSGYVIEVRWRCEQLDAIGFDVGINDPDGPDTEQGSSQYYWNGSSPGRLRESRELGRLILAAPE